MSSDRYNNVKVYRYSYLISAIYLCVLIALLVFSLFILVFFVRSFDVWCIAFMSLVGVFLLFLLRGMLSRVPILIGDDGITARVFGIKLKTVQWKNVKKIRKIRAYNGYTYVDSFRILTESSNYLCRFFAKICNGIEFTQDIRDLRELLDRLNFYAHQYGISLVVRDTQAAGAKLSGDQGPGYWKRATAEIPEVKVAEF